MLAKRPALRLLNETPAAERERADRAIAAFEDLARQPATRRPLVAAPGRARAGLFDTPTDAAEMAKHCVLTSEDLELVGTKRRSRNRAAPQSSTASLPSGANRDVGMTASVLVVQL